MVQSLIRRVTKTVQQDANEKTSFIGGCDQALR